jgi:hypothetical protein
LTQAIVIEGNVVLIVGEERTRVQLNAKLIVRLADLHAHPLVPAVEVVETQALGEGLVLASNVGFGAVGLIVAVPELED